MITLKSTLVLFYSSSPFEGYVCLTDENEVPSFIVPTDITSSQCAKNIFEVITNIDSNWAKITQTITKEYPGLGETIVDIIYLSILPDHVEIIEGYKWVKISELQNHGLDQWGIKNLIDIVSRRF